MLGKPIVEHLSMISEHLICQGIRSNAATMQHQFSRSETKKSRLGDNEIKEQRHTDVGRLKYSESKDVTKIMMTLPILFGPDVAPLTLTSCDSITANSVELFLSCNTQCQISSNSDVLIVRSIFGRLCAQRAQTVPYRAGPGI